MPRSGWTRWGATMRWPWPELRAALLALPIAAPAAAQPDAAALYGRHCAGCHGAERLGGRGPALLPESMGRLRPPQAGEVIARGRPATQMPGFADALTPPEIEALAAFVFRPAPSDLRWGVPEIEATRSVLMQPESLPARPVFDADPLNLFLVIETGDHHATVLDGDRFTPNHRFPTRPGAARRAEVLAGRALRLPDVARRLGDEVRPPRPAARGRGAGRGEQPQHRAVRRRALRGRRQL